MSPTAKLPEAEAKRVRSWLHDYVVKLETEQAVPDTEQIHALLTEALGICRKARDKKECKELSAVEERLLDCLVLLRNAR